MPSGYRAADAAGRRPTPMPPNRAAMPNGGDVGRAARRRRRSIIRSDQYQPADSEWSHAPHGVP
ncbi:hypothetical protein ACFFRL_13110 [Agromyces hippuratus]|uniref:hypothetical protein n=1 Tax=Agromyces hippuratus TaxID=286438 RepID=UPI0035ED4626